LPGSLDKKGIVLLSKRWDLLPPLLTNEPDTVQYY
jgi:hypothetical protein